MFRKLAELSYRTSYSHRGRYYTLAHIPHYDQSGLWSFRSVWFSERGTLMATAAALVETSEAGFYRPELEALLNVDVKATLLKLVRQDRLSRHRLAGRYLYCASPPAHSRHQLSARRLLATDSPPAGSLPHPELTPEELKAATVLFFCLLDEKQRRLYAGLESLKLGHGGDQRIATLLGLNASTVARGRRELLGGEVEPERVRRRGAGRKAVERTPPRSSPTSKR